MTPDRAPLFVGRRAYYRRRLADAARLMPVLGIGLFMFPLFWIVSEPTAPSTVQVEPVSTVSVMFYLFTVWVALAVASGLISRSLEPESKSNQTNRAGGVGAAD